MKTGLKKISLYLVFLIFLGIILRAWWHNSASLFSADFRSVGGVSLAIARLLGLIAALLLPLQLILIGRVKWVETVFGLDKLSRLHRINGLVILGLILAHPFLILLSYTQLNETRLIPQYLMFLKGDLYDIVWASLGFLLLLGSIIWSLSIVRRKLKYEWWYYVHVFNYLAIAMIFLHVREYAQTSQYIIWPIMWWGIYVFTALNVIWFRFTRPMLRLWQHRFVVSRVEDLGLATSIYISGQNMDKFKIEAGQFMIFRFLQNPFWWQAHPFSLSWSPSHLKDSPGELRLTAKKLGDFTNELPKIKVGTPVIIDGPHGVYTERLISRDKLLFIAGGIGITPIRSMLEDLGTRFPDKILLYSNKTPSDVILKDEVQKLSQENNFRLVNIFAEPGNTAEDSGAEHGRLDKAMLARLVPDIAQRDIFLCGPPPMMLALRKACVELGVPKKQIHFERFAL